MDDIISEALAAFATAEAYESENRAAALEGLRFARLRYDGLVWPIPPKKGMQPNRPTIGIS